MQSDTRDRKYKNLARRFATRKQEVQSLYLSGFDDHQISGLTGVHRRNVSKYVRDKSTPRSVPRELLRDEMQLAVQSVGEPRYSSCISPPLSVTAGVSNVISTAYTAIDKCEEETKDEDVEHYYDRVLERLKRGKEDGSD
jgi:hypothetical protein